MREWLISNQIIRNALFTDGTREFRNPVEAKLNDIVCFRFRTAINNVDEVHIVMNGVDDSMQLSTQTHEYFNLYEKQIEIRQVDNEYYFYVVKYLENGQQEICYYNAIGVTDYISEENRFRLTAGFTTPEWAKGAVFYQIFVDRFFNGDTSNDVQDNEYKYLGEGVTEVKKWKKYPSSMGVREFYGGDLLGVIKKLDYLQELGVEALYLNPIFVSPSNHKYDIQDYDYVDPHYGVIVKDCQNNEQTPMNNKESHQYIQRVTDKENLEASNEMLVRLVEEAHKRGIRIILDGVFNHCGSFNKWLDREGIYENADGYEKGAYVDRDSKYNSYFHFYKDEWPYNNAYEGWWGHDTLPKLNYEHSSSLYEYIMHIARKWVSPPFNVDGWRLDVAADLGRSAVFNHQFWRDFRKNVRKANPDALILAEHYGDASEWLSGDQWDSVMNYDAFMEPVTWFLTGMEKHSDEYRHDLLGNAEAFRYNMNRCMARFQTQSLLVAMNELSNHDHSRFLTRTNHTAGRIEHMGPLAAEDNVNYAMYRAGVVMLFTWIGAPTIYYGDEAGVCGWTDPDNRRTYPWGEENNELIQLYKELITIHKSYDALKVGSIKILYGEQDVLAYSRFDSIDKFIVVINISKQEKQVYVPAWEVGICENDPVVQIFETTSEGFHRMANTYYKEKGMIHFLMKPESAIIVKNYVYTKIEINNN